MQIRFFIYAARGAMTIDRREFLQATAAIAATGVVARSVGDAHAKAPLQTAQNASFYRFKTGDIEVTSITDGGIDLELRLFPNADKAEAEAILAKTGRPKTGSPASINAFIVNTGGKLIVVDTGTGTFFGPQAGLFAANLSASGYSPDQVDAVIITHMHPDHLGGLTKADGKPAFANAQILVNEDDYKFWTDEVITAKAPDEAKPFFRFAQATMKAYEGKVERFRDGTEFAPGVTAVAAPGHTPGHTMIRVSSGKSSLLIWGDIVHATALQFARPEWAISFDSDQAAAVATRKKVFDQVSGSGTMVAGAHLDFPGIGFVARESSGYSYHPAFWSPKL
jgi:glyoxylase-like metal-dependent hydrolase (beta-lactamase superfamily II)